MLHSIMFTTNALTLLIMEYIFNKLSENVYLVGVRINRLHRISLGTQTLMLTIIFIVYSWKGFDYKRNLKQD